MTKTEFAPVMQAIRELYPNELKTENAKELWFRLLQDLPGERVKQAVLAHMMTSVYPPRPADVRKMCIEHDEQLTEAEAWAMVHRAIRNSTYSAKEEFDKLPPAVQRAVGSFENLRSMATDDDFNLGVESSNFKRAYRAAIDSANSYALLPEGVREKLPNLKLIGGEEE